MRKIDPKNISFSERVEMHNNTILNAYILEALEKFYSKDVTMQENENDIMIGKDACHKKRRSYCYRNKRF